MTDADEKVYGVFDVGSNSVRCLVVKGGRTLYRRLVTTRLGEGLATSGKISDEAKERTIKGACSLLGEALSFSPDKIFAFATEAVRSAENGGEFKEAFKDALGIPLDVISGDKEGEIGLLGALGGKDGGIIDIGGASAEITACENRKIIYSHSLPLGAVRLKDLCGEDEGKLKEVIDGRIDEYGKIPVTTYYAIGGTATSLAAVCLGLKKYDCDRVNGSEFTYETVCKAYETIKNSSIKDRVEKLNITPKRAEIIVGGVYLLKRIAERIPLKRIIVSENDNMLGYVMKNVYGKSLD